MLPTLVLTVGLAAAGAALYWAVARHLPAGSASARLPWPVLSLAFATTTVFAVHIEFRRHAHSFMLSELPLVVGRSAADAGIVQAAVSVGRHLGLQVVAEGVEDDAALRRLVDMGCDLVQGYLVGRPMPADDLFQVARAALTAGLGRPGRGS